jgi:hypothetical protein
MYLYRHYGFSFSKLELVFGIYSMGVDQFFNDQKNRTKVKNIEHCNTGILAVIFSKRAIYPD